MINRRGFLALLGSAIAIRPTAGVAPEHGADDYARAVFAKGMLTPNEVRAMEDLHPIGPCADGGFLVPSDFSSVIRCDCDATEWDGAPIAQE